MSDDRPAPRQEPTGPEEHIWRTEAPRPAGQRTPGAALIGLAFIAVVVVLLLIAAYVIVSGGLIADAPPGPQP